MAILWVLVLSTLLAAFLVVDGVGRGAGMLLVAVGDRAVRDATVRAVGPLYLGGHVWLVGAAGVFLGAFPAWEGPVFAAAFGWVLAVVVGLVLRGPALEFRRKAGTTARARWTAGWDVVISAASVVSAAGAGGLVAVAAGAPGAIGAVTVVAADLALGALYLRSGGVLTDEVRRWARAAVGVAALVVAAVGVVTLGAVLVARGGWLAAPVVAVTLACWARAGATARVGRPSAWRWAALGAAAVPFLVAAHLPRLAVPDVGPVPLAALASGPAALGLLLTALPVLVLLLAVQAWWWRSIHRRPALPYY